MFQLGFIVLLSLLFLPLPLSLLHVLSLLSLSLSRRRRLPSSFVLVLALVHLSAVLAQELCISGFSNFIGLWNGLCAVFVGTVPNWTRSEIHGIQSAEADVVVERC